MEQFKGKSILKGIAIGRILYYSKNQQQVKREKIADVEQETARYDKARAIAIEQLGTLYDKAFTEVGEANAMIFKVHAMM